MAVNQPTIERPLPYNLEAEEAVLGSMLMDPDAITRVVSFLKPDDFYREKHAWIYEALLALNERDEPVDTLTVVDELDRMGRLADVGGPAAVTELFLRVPTAIHVEYYGRIVERNSVLRKLIGAAEQIARLAYQETDADVAEIMDRAESLLFAISQRRLTGAMVPIREILADFYDQVEHLFMDRRAVGLQTAFPDLDRLLGGLQRGDLIIIAARPAMGKTAFSLSITEQVAIKYGARVAYFSLEMSADQLVARLVSSQTGIDVQRLRVGPIYEEDLERVGLAVDVLGRTRIFVDESPNVSPLEMRTKSRRVASEYGLDLVVIDYLQLMRSDFRTDNRVQEISYISRALKGLARELHVPVIALSQLSRGVESRQDKRPMLSDLRESGCLAGDTLVPMADTGVRVAIRDLAGQAGFAVWALNPETLKLERSVVSNAFSTGVKKVYRLTTKLGRTIRATANHKFLTIGGWKRLDELIPGDHIALPRVLHSPTEQTMTDSELALLGHLIGDGCTLPGHAIQYTTKEKDLAEIVTSLATEVFGDEVKPRLVKEERRTWYQVFIPTTRQITHGVRNPVSEWLDEMGIFGLRSYEKHIPDKVFAQPSKAIALFLRHLWATDGCVRMRKTNTGSYPAVYFASSSEKLARDVQSLLIRLGINARIKQVPQNDKGLDQYHVIITGRPDLDYFSGQIGAVGEHKNKTLRKLQEYIGKRDTKSNRDLIPVAAWDLYAVPAMQASGLSMPKPHSKNITRSKADTIARTIHSEAFAHLAESDVYWDRIASIQADGEADVYDLTVETNHDFVANDIVVSNSIEQDADVVAFIYRDEVYNKNTDRPNIAEVIVAKHRNGPIGTIELRFTKENAKFTNLETLYDEENMGPINTDSSLDDIIF